MSHTTLIFGKTGSGKTTSLGEAAKYLYKKTGGRIGRWICSDKGGWKPAQGIADAGIVEVYNIVDEPNMPVLIHKLARGYWPTALEQGQRPKGVKLAPPTEESMKNVGFYFYEGLTSTAEELMKYLRDRQIPIGGDAVGKFTVKDEDGKDVLFCANNMKHYDWVQGEMMVVLSELTALPVPNVIISANEAAGTDDDSRDTIRGPQVIGKAATARVGKNVGDCIHYETYTKTEGQVNSLAIRAYFKSHPDPKFPTINYDCKARIPLSQIPTLDKKFPGGYFDPKLLGEFLGACDDATKVAAAEAAEWKAAIDKELGR